MHSSKLVKVLRTLTREEFKKLQKFLQKLASGDRTGIGDSLLLFSAIANYYPDFLPVKIEKKKIFKKVYPKEVYKTGKLEKQMSNLFALLSEFILQQQKGVRQSNHDLLSLAAFYRSRYLDNLADSCLKKYRKGLNQNQIPELDDFYDLFLLEKQNANYKALLLNSKEIPDFSTALKTLDHYYIFEKLELACRMLAIHRYVYPVNIEDSLDSLVHLEPLLEAERFKIPVILVYYRAYRLLQANEKEAEQHFQAFEKVFKQYYTQLPEKQLLPLNTIIRNHCISQYHNGVKGYLQKSFEVYREHLEKGFLYSEGQLFAGTMMNLVISGLRLGHSEWVYRFIKSHQDRLTGTDSPEEFSNLCLANYFFYTKKYDSALDLLTENYEYLYYRLAARRLEIKIYFELQHVLLAPRVDAFKIYIYRLTRKKITQKHETGNRNFIDMLKQIQLPRTFQNTRRINKLIEKIKDFHHISEKEWLLEKLEALR